MPCLITNVSSLALVASSTSSGVLLVDSKFYYIYIYIYIVLYIYIDFVFS